MTGEMIAAAIKAEFEKVSSVPVYNFWIAPEEVKKPFISIGTVSEGGTTLKGGTSEEVTIGFHCWSTRLDRRMEMSQILTTLEDIARRLVIDGLSLCLTSSTRRILTDTTTTTPYLHGVVFLDFLH